jgi:hypothetical protein
MIGSMKNQNPESKQHVNKRVLIAFFFVIINLFVPYILREIFPHNYIVSILFGGIRLVLFWITTFILYCSIDLVINKRIK